MPFTFPASCLRAAALVRLGGLALLGTLLFSTAALAGAPLPPTNVTAVAGNAQVTISWTASSGATSYNIYRGTSAGGESTTAIKTGQTASPYVNTGLTNGTTYYYKVKAVNSSGTSAYSSEANAKPLAPPSAPTGLAVTAISSSQLNVTWSVTTNASSYKVERSPDGSTGWTQIAAPTVNSYSDTGRTAATKYYYRVRATDVGGDSGYSSVANGTTWTLAPTGLTATAASTTQINLIWSAATGATSYNVYRGTTSGGESSTAIKTGLTTPSYSNTGLSSGATYFYTVKAVNAGGTSLASNEASTSTKPGTPGGLTAAPGNNTVRLTWTAVTGATAYNVKRSATSNGTYATIGTTTGNASTAYSDNTAVNGVTYYYEVSAVASGVEGANSAFVSATPLPLPTAPTNLTASGLGQANANLAWTAGANVAYYKIERSLDNSTWSQITTWSPTTYQDFGLAGGTVYYYRIRSSNAAGDSAYSNTATALTSPASPASLTATAGAGQISLTWAATTNTTSYTVRRGNAHFGPYTAIASSVTGTTYVDRSLPPLNYYYVVDAVNATGTGTDSPEATAVPTAPGGTPAYQINSGGTAVAPFQADQYVSPVSSISAGAAVDISWAASPAPALAYSDAETDTASFTYTLPALVPGAAYTVRLHYAEVNAYATAGYRVCNVTVNGASVLTNFDIMQAAGAPLKAVVEQYNTTADSSGNITIVHTGVTGQPICNAVEVITGNSAPAPPVLKANGGNGQITLTWAAVVGATGYNVKRSSTQGGPYTQITSTTGTSVTDTVANGATYYYVVTATNAYGEGYKSNEVSYTLTGDGHGVAYRINCGGGTAAPFIADNYFSAGNTSSTSDPIDLSLAFSPAPMAVYQSYRYGSFSYVLPGLQASTPYTVRLHFAELYWGLGGRAGAGQRLVDVTINGVQVLSGFDTAGAAGAAEKAISEQFNATTDASGSFTIQIAPHAGSPDTNAVINGIEVLTGKSAPAPPVKLTATAGNGSATLSWIGYGATSYTLQRATQSGGPYTAVATQSATSYTNTGLTNGQTYYYIVTAANDTGSSGNSNQASVTPSGPAVLQVSCGGPTVGSWVADVSAPGVAIAGGSSETLGNTVDTTTATNAAPAAVYSSRRYGDFTYTVSSLSPNTLYTVRLHFAELYINNLGRLMNISLNGTPVLPNFDIVQAIGGINRAVVESFNVTSDNSGSITIAVASAAVGYYAQLNGFELYSGGSAPAAPINLQALGGAGQVSLFWNAVQGATGYNIYRTTTSRSGYVKLNASPATAATYTDSTAVNGTRYYYVASAVSAYGEGGFSNEASALPAAAGGTAYQINCGGPATAPFQMDQFFSGGGFDVSANNIDLSGALNPAPAAVYQSRRFVDAGGSFGYSFPHLTPGGAYTVRLHFADVTGSGPGQRYFDVAINGTTVLPNFDIVPAAGGINKAVVESFPATADGGGNLTLTFNAHLAKAQVNGIEILSGSTGPPAAPTDLRAAAGNTQVGLTWNAVAGATTYSIKRSATSGGPYTTLTTSIPASASPNYSDPLATGGAAYYYVATASNANGESRNSNEAVTGPAFTLSANPTTLTVTRTGPTTAVGTIVGSSTVNFTNPVTLTITGAPAGLTVWAYGNPFLIPSQYPYPTSVITGNSKLHICVAAGTTPGTYPLTITGVSGDYAATTTVTVTVN